MFWKIRETRITGPALVFFLTQLNAFLIQYQKLARIISFLKPKTKQKSDQNVVIFSLPSAHAPDCSIEKIKGNLTLFCTSSVVSRYLFLDVISAEIVSSRLWLFNQNISRWCVLKIYVAAFIFYRDYLRCLCVIQKQAKHVIDSN